MDRRIGRGIARFIRRILPENRDFLSFGDACVRRIGGKLVFDFTIRYHHRRKLAFSEKIVATAPPDTCWASELGV